MKLIITASAILALLTGAASAASNQAHERPDWQATASASQQKSQVEAGSQYLNKELTQWNLQPSDVVDLTVFPTKDYVKPRGNDNN